MSFWADGGKEGNRALMIAVLVVLLAFLLSLLLKDASPFNITAPGTALGKFGYDAVRARGGPRRMEGE